MCRVGVSSSVVIAAEAGFRVADEGGDAVDAAIGALLVSLNTGPGVYALESRLRKA